MKSVTVDYRVKKVECECCGQELPNETFTERKFEFSRQDVLEYGDWQDVMENEEDFDHHVCEYVYGTISFFAAGFFDKIIVTPKEIRKFKQFISEIFKTS